MKFTKVSEIWQIEPLPKFKTIFASHLSKFRIVGGAVRDFLLGKTVIDIDLATSFTPQELIKTCQRLGVTYKEFAVDHGTLLIIIDGKTLEITSLRRDVKTDGRHAIVEFGTDWQQDAARRDFTINAMSVDNNGNLYDYNNGQQDLAASKLQFIGDIDRRIKEDYLRIIRYARFASLLAVNNKVMLDASTNAIIKTHLGGLNQLSKERILSEFTKAMIPKQWPLMVGFVNELDIADVIFGNKLLLPGPDCYFKHQLSPAFYWAQILPQSSVNTVLANWPWPKQLKKQISSYRQNNANKATWYSLKQHPQHLIELLYFYHQQQLLPWNAKVVQFYSQRLALTMPVAASDLKLLVIEQKEYRHYLARAFSIWLTTDKLLSKAELLSLLVN